MLTKKTNFLEKKIQSELEAAKKHGTSNKKGKCITWIYRVFLKSPWKLNLPWKMLVKYCITRIWFSYFSIKTYVVGTQKNRLNETILLSTQNKCLNWWVRKYLQFYAENFSSSKPVTWIYRVFLKSPWKLNLPWKMLENHPKALKRHRLNCDHRMPIDHTSDICQKFPLNKF